MRKVGRSFFTFILVGLGCLVVLAGTGAGLKLVQKSIVHLTGGMVSVGQVSGRLLGSWTMTGISVTTPGADVQVENLEWDWFPEKLVQGEFHIAGFAVSGVTITLKDTPAAESDGGPLQLPDNIWPLALAIDRFAIDRLRVFGSDGSELVVINHVGGRFEGVGGKVVLHDFSFEAPDIGFSLHGSLDMGRQWQLDVLGRWWLVGWGFHPIDGTFSLSGPLNSPGVTFGVNRSGVIRVAGKVENLLVKPEWTATLEAWGVDLSVLIENCPEIKLARVNGQVAGDTDGYRGHVKATGDWHNFTGARLDTTLTADWMGIVFDTLRIERGETLAESEGASISWQNIFDWQGHFSFKNFEPSFFTEEMLMGRLDADLSHQGKVRDDYGVDISFQVLNLDGQLQGQKIAAEGNLQLTENDISTDGLILRSGDVEGVAYIKKGMVSWADKINWSGAVRLEKFNPAGLFHDFPGEINGDFSSDGSFSGKRPQGYVNIHNLSGQLRGQELAGKGEIYLDGENLRTTGLFVRSGASELVVEGKAGDDFALDFTLSSPDISALVPDGSGAVRIQGSLGGSLAKPLLDADLEATACQYGENSVARMQIEIHAGLWNEGVLQGRVYGEDFNIADFSVNNGKLDFSGTMQSQDIALGVASDLGQLSLKVLAVYQGDWMGKIVGFQLSSTPYGSWRQEHDTSFMVGKDGVLLDDFCFTDGEGTVCAGGDMQLSGAQIWNVHGKLAAVPLNWLNRLKLIVTPVNGVVHAEVEASGDSRNILSANLDLSLPEADMELGIEDEDFGTIGCDDTLLSLNLTDSLLRGEFSTKMRNGSQVKANAAIQGAGDFATPVLSMPLTGSLELNNFDLAVLSAVTGYWVEPTGRVNSSFILSGTLRKPQISGDSRIEGGGIALPYQGITLENVTTSIVAGENDAKVECRATSGPGELKAEGTIRYGESGVEGELQVRGRDFLLVNLPEYSFRVSPDVLFRFTKDKGEISGLIKVPYGLITPEEMTGSVTASEDVVLVNGHEEVKEKGWPFPLDLNVQLGEDVRIQGYGLTGRLTGQLNAKTGKDEILTGRGELDLVEGAFTIYGRSLDIERGRILFNGGSIDNPGIDVRAQKKVSEEEAKGEGYTVGVDISGLVQDLQYHLFSDPYMDDTEILSMMIVGHSLANSSQEEGSLLESAAVTLGLNGSTGFVQGLGSMLLLDDMHLEGSSKKENVSLVVGKRVTKDLYIGYDMNMFSQLGQFRVRYDLKRGFSVETRSSSQSTGADLLYSFEK